MTKSLTFAEKAAKLAKKEGMTVICPDTNKETKVLNVRMVEAVKTDKGTYKFIEGSIKVYESTLKPYNP